MKTRITKIQIKEIVKNYYEYMTYNYPNLSFMEYIYNITGDEKEIELLGYEFLKYKK